MDAAAKNKKTSSLKKGMEDFLLEDLGEDENASSIDAEIPVDEAIDFDVKTRVFDQLIDLSPSDDSSDDQSEIQSDDNRTAVIAPDNFISESSSEPNASQDFLNQVSQAESSQTENSTLAKAKSELNDATVAATGLHHFKNKDSSQQQAKITLGHHKGVKISSGQVHTSADASLVQAENLRMAQDRILDLEAEVDRLRAENDEVAGAGDIIRQKYEELSSKYQNSEKERNEIIDNHHLEVTLMKSKADFKDQELVKARNKVEELELRLKSDFRKIRVREKELENRIELIRAEQTALLRSKDEYILELKRKVDHLESEIENYRMKILEFNKTLDSKQDQFKKALRALRLAFTSLEGHVESGHSQGENIVPIKKAE